MNQKGKKEWMGENNTFALKKAALSADAINKMKFELGTIVLSQ